MGGDGGTCASNRRYMRGAGTADHTADSKRARAAEIAEAERDRLRQAMTTCAATGAPIDFRPSEKGGGGSVSRADVVACPYGRLYGREAAVEALLRRHGQGQGAAASEEPEVGWHVRGLKDLHPVRFHVIKLSDDGKDGGSAAGAAGTTKYVPACPITGIELTGSVPAYLIVRRKEKKVKKVDPNPESDEHEREALPNVLSERAVREMGVQGLQAEFGPFQETDMIRLAPPTAGGVFNRIKADLEQRREEERLLKKGKKGDKKRKKAENSNKAIVAGDAKKPPALTSSTLAGKKLRPSSAANAARSSVAAAVESNPVLSSLFSHGRPGLTEKEKKDNLFAR